MQFSQVNFSHAIFPGVIFRLVTLAREREGTNPYFRVKPRAGVTTSPRILETIYWQSKTKLGGDGQPVDSNERVNHRLCS